MRYAQESAREVERERERETKIKRERDRQRRKISYREEKRGRDVEKGVTKRRPTQWEAERGTQTDTDSHNSPILACSLLLCWARCEPCWSTGQCPKCQHRSSVQTAEKRETTCWKWNANVSSRSLPLAKQLRWATQLWQKNSNKSYLSIHSWRYSRTSLQWRFCSELLNKTPYRRRSGWKEIQSKVHANTCVRTHTVRMGFCFSAPTDRSAWNLAQVAWWGRGGGGGGGGGGRGWIASITGFQLQVRV